jgi:CheY-like chemotaxis protein
MSGSSARAQAFNTHRPLHSAPTHDAIDRVRVSKARAAGVIAQETGAGDLAPAGECAGIDARCSSNEEIAMALHPRETPRQHVVVVDRHPEIGAVMMMGLEELGSYRVTCAGAAEDACRLFDTDRPTLVIIDAVLPAGMSSIELAARATERSIPVLVTTDQPELDRRLARLGWHHLRRPFHLVTLLAEVRATIAESGENIHAIQASLQRIAKSSGDLREMINKIHDLRGRTDQTLTRSRRYH